MTRLLQAWNQGDREALDRLMPLVARELGYLARAFMAGERSDHTLQPTALVNECYLRLIQRDRVNWQDRAHFFAFAGSTMRRILADHARRLQRAKRGGHFQTLALDVSLAAPSRPLVDLLDVDQALARLAALDARQSRLLELRLFAGLTIEEAAEVLAVSPATVSRDWASAIAWLHQALRPG